MAITKFGSCLFFPFIFSFLSSLSLSLLFLPCLELPKPKLYAPLFWFSSYHPCLNVWFHAMNFVIRLSWIKLVNNLGQTNGQKSLIFSWWPATSLMSSKPKICFCYSIWMFCLLLLCMLHEYEIYSHGEMWEFVRIRHITSTLTLSVQSTRNSHPTEDIDPPEFGRKYRDKRVCSATQSNKNIHMCHVMYAIWLHAQHISSLP